MVPLEENLLRKTIFVLTLFSFFIFTANIYLFKVNNKDFRKKVISLFKVNNKDIRTTSLTSSPCIFYLRTDFTHFFDVSMFDFEQVN